MTIGASFARRIDRPYPRSTPPSRRSAAVSYRPVTVICRGQQPIGTRSIGTDPRKCQPCARSKVSRMCPALHGQTRNDCERRYRSMVRVRWPAMTVGERCWSMVSGVGETQKGAGFPAPSDSPGDAGYAALAVTSGPTMAAAAEPPMATRRGFSDSGTTRFSPTCSSPSRRSASSTTM